MSFFFRSNFLPSLFKRRPNAAPRRSLVLPITAAAVTSAAGVAYITYTSYADRPLRSFQVPPPPRGLLLPPLEKLATTRRPDSPSDLTGPTLLLHDHVLSLIKSGDLDSAAAALRAPDAPRPHVRTCNKLMEALSDSPRPEDAISLFNSSIQAGVVPDTDTFVFLMTAYHVGGREDDAFAALYLMLRLRDAEIVTEKLSSGRISDAVSVFKMMAVWPHLAAGSLLHRVIVQGGVDVDRVAELFDEVKRLYKLRDHALHSSLALYFPHFISPFMNLDRPSWSMGRILALLTWAWRSEKWKNAARLCYTCLLEWGLYQSMLDPVALNALLRDLLEHGDLNRVAVANVLFDKMLESHDPPSLLTLNADTCDIMVNQRLKEGRSEEAVKIFWSIWEKEKMIDVGCLNNLIRKLCEDGRASDARKLYDEMPKLPVRIYDHASIIGRSFREDRSEDALRCFSKMLHNHEGFDLRLYTKMVYGLVNAGRFDEALRVLMLAWVDIREMTEQGFDPAEPGFGLSQAARNAIKILYRQY